MDLSGISSYVLIFYILLLKTLNRSFSIFIILCIEYLRFSISKIEHQV